MNRLDDWAVKADFVERCYEALAEAEESEDTIPVFDGLVQKCSEFIGGQRGEVAASKFLINFFPESGYVIDGKVESVLSRKNFVGRFKGTRGTKTTPKHRRCWRFRQFYGRQKTAHFGPIWPVSWGVALECPKWPKRNVLFGPVVSSISTCLALCPKQQRPYRMSRRRVLAHEKGTEGSPPKQRRS